MPRLICADQVFDNVAAIAFDKDGTLANSSEFLRQLAQQRARLVDAQVPGVQDPLTMAFGLEGDQLNPAGLMAVGSRYENEIAAAAYVAETGRDWSQALAIVQTAFREAEQGFPRKAAATKPFTGALELLKTLYSEGIKLAIISGDTHENVRDFVACYGLEDMVGCCIGSDRGLSKPDPALLQAACDQLSVAAQQMLVIGDSELDNQLAQKGQAAGFVGVIWGGNSAPATAEVVVSAPEQIQLA